MTFDQWLMVGLAVWNAALTVGIFAVSQEADHIDGRVEYLRETVASHREDHWLVRNTLSDLMRFLNVEYKTETKKLVKK